jgi:hypothetical protein
LERIRVLHNSCEPWHPKIIIKATASSSQRANSLVPSATVGVAISNSAITMGAFSTFSMTLSQDRRLGALIVTHTDLAHHTKNK